jgi:hypothetical protein
MICNKVIARFKEGSVIKGYAFDFSPLKTSFHLNKENGEVVQIDTRKLKALFFVKDLNGNQYYYENYNDIISGTGKKVEVHFNDDEVVTGYTMSCSPDRHGFFLTPADCDCNNERIFVIKTATKKINFKKASILN